MRHIPVLLKEVISSLNLKMGAKIIDCTVGDGGHSEAILDVIGPKGRLLAIDADPESLMRAKNNLYRYGDQVDYVRANFANLTAIAAEQGWPEADGILIDLGWSTPQFMERQRGFSFNSDEPLDMRFDPISNLVTASKLVNELPKGELVRILHLNAEEKLADEIVTEILLAREIGPIKTSKQLTDLVLKVYRTKLNSDKEVPWVGGIHPATKTFQALRIAVNNEFGVLRQVLDQAMNILKSGGRLGVISFHSLEDRIVKQYFQKMNNKSLRIITKKPISATDEELNTNPSSRSAKLRVVEKI